MQHFVESRYISELFCFRKGCVINRSGKSLHNKQTLWFITCVQHLAYIGEVGNGTIAPNFQM